MILKQDNLFWASNAMCCSSEEVLSISLFLLSSENFPISGVITRAMKLNFAVAAASPSKCKFPLWLTAFQHWHTLDYRRSYSFHKHNTTLRITNTTAQPGANQHASSGGTVQGYVTCITIYSLIDPWW